MKYNPRNYCHDNISGCLHLLERDFFAGRITEKTYKKEIDDELFKKKTEQELLERIRLEKQAIRKAQNGKELDA